MLIVICSESMEAMLKFKFNETKGVEAFTFIAKQWPNVTYFYASKILFYAEKYHLNKFGRPIVADTFVAMNNGPVPSTMYDFVRGKLFQAGDAEAVQQALTSHGPKIIALKEPDLTVLSQSDIECLQEAIQFCKDKPFGYLSDLTHSEKAWLEAFPNGPMDYALMIEDSNPNKALILEEATEFARYGVL